MSLIKTQFPISTSNFCSGNNKWRLAGICQRATINQIALGGNAHLLRCETLRTGRLRQKQQQYASRRRRVRSVCVCASACSPRKPACRINTGGSAVMVSRESTPPPHSCLDLAALTHSHAPWARLPTSSRQSARFAKQTHFCSNRPAPLRQRTGA